MIDVHQNATLSASFEGDRSALHLLTRTLMIIPNYPTFIAEILNLFCKRINSWLILKDVAKY